MFSKQEKQALKNAYKGLDAVGATIDQKRAVMYSLLQSPEELERLADIEGSKRDITRIVSRGNLIFDPRAVSEEYREEELATLGREMYGEDFDVKDFLGQQGVGFNPDSEYLKEGQKNRGVSLTKGVARNVVLAACTVAMAAAAIGCSTTGAISTNLADILAEELPHPSLDADSLAASNDTLVISMGNFADIAYKFSSDIIAGVYSKNALEQRLEYQEERWSAVRVSANLNPELSLGEEGQTKILNWSGSLSKEIIESVSIGSSITGIHYAYPGLPKDWDADADVLSLTANIPGLYSWAQRRNFSSEIIDRLRGDAFYRQRQVRWTLDGISYLIFNHARTGDVTLKREGKQLEQLKRIQTIMEKAREADDIELSELKTEITDTEKDIQDTKRWIEKNHDALRLELIMLKRPVRIDSNIPYNPLKLDIPQIKSETLEKDPLIEQYMMDLESKDRQLAEAKSSKLDGSIYTALGFDPKDGMKGRLYPTVGINIGISLSPADSKLIKSLEAEVLTIKHSLKETVAALEHDVKSHIKDMETIEEQIPTQTTAVEEARQAYERKLAEFEKSDKFNLADVIGSLSTWLWLESDLENNKLRHEELKKSLFIIAGRYDR